MRPDVMPAHATLVYVAIRMGKEPRARFVAVTVEDASTEEGIIASAERIMERRCGRGWRWMLVSDVVIESTTGNSYHDSTERVGGVGGFVLSLEQGLESVNQRDAKRLSGVADF